MRFFEELTNLAGKDRRVLIAVLFLLVIVPVGLILFIYGSKGNYSVAFNELNDEDMYRIVSLLKDNGIHYKFDEKNTRVLVRDSDVHTSRMLVMQNNLITSGNVGFEIFNDSEFGMTEFSQKVNYQRALQGELSRTISSLDEIDFARLHLVQPTTSIFEDKEKKPRASVTLFVKSGMTLSQQQIIGIQRIVAYSIDKMDVNNVIIADQGGHILSGHKSETMEVQEEKLKRKKNIESLYTDKIDEAIRKHVESGKYSISVNVNLDYTKIKKSKESFLNDNNLVSSERVSNSKNGKNMVKDVEYMHGKEVITEENEYGSIKNIQVAVLINYQISQDVVEMLNEVVLRSIGYDKERGDVVTVRASDIPKYHALDEKHDEVKPEVNIPTSDAEVEDTTISAVKSSEHSNILDLLSVTFDQLIISMFSVIVLLSIWVAYLSFGSKKRIMLTQQQRDEFAKEVNNWLASKNNV